jgi:hypothetical protein
VQQQLHLLLDLGVFRPGHGATDAGCRDPAITACGGPDLHAGIGGASQETRLCSLQ